MISYDVLAYRLFRGLSRRLEKSFPKIGVSLNQAGLNFTVDEWISLMILNSVLTFLLVSVSVIVLSLSVGITFVESVAIAFLTSGFFSGGVFLLTYYYPSQAASTRNKKIDNSLHFATIYMATLAGTGMPPYKIFKVLSKYDEFKEISKIARGISQDMDVFGLDFNEALERAANNAPNKDLHDLLWNLRSTIQSGGDVRKFLEQRAVALTNQYRRKLEGYVKTLSLFLEIYITVVIVGSVFALVLTTIMGVLGGSTEQIQLIQLILITLGLPAMSLAFIVILKTINPMES